MALTTNSSPTTVRLSMMMSGPTSGMKMERGSSTAREMWQALVNYSKYKVWPDFRNFEDGHILLQYHGDEMRFRNIEIKPMD